MIQREDRDNVVILTLDHGKVNAFDLELVEALGEAFEQTREAGAVVLTGAGRAFSAGVDLHRFLAGGDTYAREFIRALEHTFEKVAVFPRPLIVAINGHAIAGGAVIAAGADLTLMGDGKGRIGAPELLVGVPFPALALELLRFSWPGQHLQSLIYRGRTLDCREALALGLVDEVIDAEDLLEAAVGRAKQMASITATVFSLSKRQMRQPLMDRVARQNELYGEEVRQAWSHASTRQAIRDYLERTLGK